MAEGPRTIHLFHHTLARGGGMERYAETLAGAFRELGCPVVFHAQRIDLKVAETWQVKPDLVGTRSFPRKLRDYRFFRAVERAAPGLRGEGVEISLWRVPVRDLVICGGTHRGYLRRTGRWPGLFDWLQIWMERKAYAKARKVISHSPLCTEELQALYRIPAAKVATLYPPVSEQFKMPVDAGARQQARARLGLPQEKVVFLFPSTGHTRKGLEPIRQALASLGPDLVLAVAGKAPGHGQAGCVRYLGYVGDMAEAYHAADFTILGSYYEPFGLVGPESLLCGTQLVFERNIGCLPAIDPAYVTLFDVNNPGTIREAAEKCLQLAREKRHGMDPARKALSYDPSPARHARELLRLGAERWGYHEDQAISLY